MANPRQQPSIWNQMAYTPPRGPCSQKLSLLTSCPCFRFMIHPLKASTSFDCDGCGHHASYHRMQNEQEEETARRWREDEERKFRDRENERWRSVEDVMEEVAPKRKRIEGVQRGKNRLLAEVLGNGEVGVVEETEEVVEVVEEVGREKTVGGGSKRRRR